MSRTGFVGRIPSVRDEGIQLLYVQELTEIGALPVLLVRPEGDAAGLMATARSVAAQIDGTVPIEIGLMDQHLDRHVGPARVLAALMSGISLLAWGVAILGTYGLFSQLVASRTREIGVRIALGAGRSAILKSVLGRAVVLGVIGVGVGLVLWRLTGKLLGSLIYGVDVTDPLVLTGVSVSVLAVTSLASYLPARRATRIDPVSVLSRTARR